MYAAQQQRRVRCFPCPVPVGLRRANTSGEAVLKCGGWEEPGKKKMWQERTEVG